MPAPHSIEDLAYMAGIIDGEGSITLPAEYGRSLSLLLVVGNTSRVLIDWMHSRFDGNVTETPIRRLSKRRFWTWYVRGDAASDVLGLVLPYMKVKAPQAALGIEAWRNREPTIGATPLTAEVRQRRLDYHLRMRELNGRLPPDSPRIEIVNSKYQPVELVCMQCGVTFERWPSRIKPSGRAFCNATCARLWHKTVIMPTLSGVRWQRKRNPE